MQYTEESIFLFKLIYEMLKFKIQVFHTSFRKTTLIFQISLQSCQCKLWKMGGLLGFATNFYWCVVRFLLTQRFRLGGPFRYLEHVCKIHRKFSRGLWKKVSPQKMGVCQNIPTPFWAPFFSKSQHFSLFLTYNLIGVSCGHDFFTDAKI